MPSILLVEASRAQIEPLLTSVIDSLDAAGNAYPMTFFTRMLITLRTIEEEAELLALFFELSTTAFQGFAFSAAEARLIDALLAECEAIALTLSVGGEHPPH